jgi:hypothetical protein
MTKWVVGTVVPNLLAYPAFTPDVLRFATVTESLQTPYGLSATPVYSPRRSAIVVPVGPPFQYWLGQSP